MLRTGKFSDVTVLVGQDSDAQAFRLHKTIICDASRYFADKLLHVDDEQQANNTIRVSGVEPSIFELLVKYMYGKPFKLPREINSSESQKIIVKIYVSAKKLQMAALVNDIIAAITERIVKLKIITLHKDDQTFEQDASDLGRLISNICDQANGHHWYDLRQLIDPTIGLWSLSGKDFEEALMSNRMGIKYLVTCQSLQDLTKSLFCNHCRLEGLWEKAGPQCLTCDQEMPTTMDDQGSEPST